MFDIYSNQDVSSHCWYGTHSHTSVYLMEELAVWQRLNIQLPLKRELTNCGKLNDSFPVDIHCRLNCFADLCYVNINEVIIVLCLHVLI